MTLEEEIIQATERVQTRTTEFETKISDLDKNITTYTNWAWGFVYAGIAIAVFGIIAYLVIKDSNKFGLNLLGDFYGGSVASIWSLAGLFFIYVAFLGQKQQLLNQQMEIMYSQIEVKYTRLELEGQKKEMVEQNQTLRQQRFENTFFQLLRNHQDIVSGIDIRTSRQGQSTVINEGRDCFKSFYGYLLKRLDREKGLQKTIEVYMEVYNDHQSDLGHYFRHLYHILKFVNTSKEVAEEDKFKYTSLIRALLSSYELSMLFYNCLGAYGKDYFKPLVEKYSFLKNLDHDLIVDKEHFKSYDELAFASSSKRKELIARVPKTAANIGIANSGA
jgi:Putative phage abortive infection protein